MEVSEPYTSGNKAKHCVIRKFYVFANKLLITCLIIQCNNSIFILKTVILSEGAYY